LNVHGVNDIRQTDLNTAELLVPQNTIFDFEIAIEKLIRYKPPGTDQILAELIQTGGNILHSKIHKLINSISMESILVPVYKNGDTTDCSNYRGISVLPTTYKFYPVFFLKVNSICRRNNWESSVWIST